MSKNNMSSISNSSSEASRKSGIRTDWARLDALTDADVDTSDIPALTEEDFVQSKWRFPPTAGPDANLTPQAVVVEVSVDGDTLAWFQSQGQDYPQRMRAALRLYADAHRAAV